jgi:CheY-like chemotaxis protein
MAYRLRPTAYHHPHETPRPPQRPRVLVVDADSDFRRACRDSLIAHSYDVDEQFDARVALASALQRPPEFVITATRTRGFEGIDLCHLLRRDPATQSVPLLLLASSHAEAARLSHVSVDRLLSKPLAPGDVLHEIERLRREREISELPEAERMPHDGAEVPAHRRRASELRTSCTRRPPVPPLSLTCANCDRTLQYLQSYIGGADIRRPEQWDIFRCESGCGMYECRRSTGRVTRCMP